MAVMVRNKKMQKVLDSIIGRPSNMVKSKNYRKLTILNTGMARVR